MKMQSLLGMTEIWLRQGKAQLLVVHCLKCQHFHVSNVILQHFSIVGEKGQRQKLLPCLLLHMCFHRIKKCFVNVTGSRVAHQGFVDDLLLAF